VDNALAGLTDRQVAALVVPYEPVWAIGTGKVASAHDAQEFCSAIRARISQVWGAAAAGALRVLYGGSVKASSAAAIMAEEDTDGCPLSVERV
jgi:triosephosphate isomerase (TIM)